MSVLTHCVVVLVIANSCDSPYQLNPWPVIVAAI